MRVVLGRIRGRRHAPPPAGSRRGRARSGRVKKGEGRGTRRGRRGREGAPAGEKEGEGADRLGRRRIQPPRGVPAMDLAGSGGEGEGPRPPRR